MSEDEQIRRLLAVDTALRWVFIAVLWLTCGTVSLWHLREELELMAAQFTWAALRVGLMYNPRPFFGLAFCLAMTQATLVWQSWHILFGVNQRERKRLLGRVHKIRTRGRQHPLWRWVCQ
ncbi:MAG: hypothetical protein HC919_08525 [Oscillatoriales cyanobacterium SM2_2_1]|nr:hypothetical protein [Oscillatoriales cyanobacterium SM2_2_1]